MVPLGQGPTTWRDADGDGAGDPTVWSGTCHAPGEGWVQNFLDCDDADPTLDASTCPPAPRATPRALVDTPDFLTGPGLLAEATFGIGDLDGDGRHDLIVGHLYEARRVSGISGHVDASRVSTISGEFMPVGAAAVDGDGDGDLDLALAFDQRLGVFHARPDGPVSIEDADLRVAPPFDGSFARVGRVDDGRVWASDTSAVYLLDATRTGDHAAEELGEAFLGVPEPQPAFGDLDGDGLPELVVGQPERVLDAQEVGSVWVAPLDTPGVVPDLARGAWVGDVQLAGLGAQVAVGPDVDGDGLDDVLARTVDDRAFLFTAAPDGEVPVAAGAAAILSFGPDEAGDPSNERWQALPGDLDGDGFGDVAIAVDPQAGAERTEIVVLPGPLSGTLDLATAPRWVYEADTIASLTAGDFDGDGLPEIAVALGNVYVVGAPW